MLELERWFLVPSQVRDVFVRKEDGRMLTLYGHSYLALSLMFYDALFG